MPLTTLVGKVGLPLGQPLIRKPGDLPVPKDFTGGRGVPRPVGICAGPSRMMLSGHCPAKGWMMATTLFVCTTCKAGLPLEEGQMPAGARLHADLSVQDLPDGVRVQGAECLSACNNGCAIALSAPGRWTYVYGRLGMADIPEILSGAAAYAASPDGIVPWRMRPVIFRKQSLARIPPLEAPHD